MLFIGSHLVLVDYLWLNSQCSPYFWPIYVYCKQLKSTLIVLKQFMLYKLLLNKKGVSQEQEGSAKQH